MSRLMALLFALFIALDTAALGLWLLLGLAAAKPSHTPAIEVLAFFSVPALVLVALVLLYWRGPWGLSRPLATWLAGLPLIVVVGAAWLSQGLGRIAGGPAMEAPPRQDGTALVAALRQLELAPDDHAPLQALLAAGLSPNAIDGREAPLALAIRISRKTGAEPVRLLLRAGANPNHRHGAQPAWFAALSPNVDAAVLPLLLAHGVNLRAVDMAGNDALYWAAWHKNAAAAALLQQHGAATRR